MTKREKQRADILKHGKDLLRIFKKSPYRGDPTGLCRRVRRLEMEGERFALLLCNGPVPSMEDQEEIKNSIKDRLRQVLGRHKFKVFLNLDPRGYALKICDEDVRKNELKIQQDWGGYGLIAPEL